MRTVEVLAAVFGPPGMARVFREPRIWLSLLLAGTALACTGCPELNRWNGPSEDPFFSVPDDDRQARRAEMLYRSRQADAIAASLGEATPPDIADHPSAPSPKRN